MNKRLKKLSGEALICRDLMHSWKPYTVASYDRHYWRTVVCANCTAERTDKINRQGKVVGRKYIYPDRYLLEEGSLTAQDRADIRLYNLKAGV